MTDRDEKRDYILDKYALRSKAEAIVNDKIVHVPALSHEKIKTVFLELEVHRIELEMQNEELRRSQEELQESKNLYFDLYNMAPVCYCSINNKNIITQINFRASETLGVERSKLMMRPISDFIFTEDQDIFYLHKKSVASSSKPHSCELRLVTKEGSIIWVHMSTTVLKEDGKNTYRLVFSDISEKKRAEEELKKRDDMILAQAKYVAMGEMISMIAHQWRQPLNIIGLAIASIQTKKTLKMLDAETIDENSNIISENISYMSRTIDDFRHFFKSDMPKEYTQMEDIINTTIKVIGKSLEYYGISLKIQNDSKTSILIQKSSLMQVLLNILGNAKDALVSNNVADARINLTVNETDDAFILSICDNAGGIPEDVMNKINQPYFTTKQENGTGLGVYIAQTIIEKQLSGSLAWHNTLKGACFVVTLKKK